MGWINTECLLLLQKASYFCFKLQWFLDVVMLTVTHLACNQSAALIRGQMTDKTAEKGRQIVINTKWFWSWDKLSICNSWKSKVDHLYRQSLWKMQTQKFCFLICLCCFTSFISVFKNTFKCTTWQSRNEWYASTMEEHMERVPEN